MRRLLLSCLLLLIPLGVFALPLQTAILSPSEEEVGTALIYIDYVELLDPSKQKMGKIAYVMREGVFEMLLIKEDEDKSRESTRRSNGAPSPALHAFTSSRESILRKWRRGAPRDLLMSSSIRL